MTMQNDVISKRSKKLRPIKGVVAKALKETADTWTLYIEVLDEDKDYLAGQFISISPHQFAVLKDFVSFFEYQKQKRETVRAYSLTSAPHEKYVAITIKPDTYEPYPGSYPPLLSPLLASDLLVGKPIEFLGYTGAYVMPHDLDPSIDNVVHLVAGSGIVPSFSIIKDELYSKKRPTIKHTLIYANKTIKDIIFHAELIELEKQYSDRFKIIYFVSQEIANLPSPSYLPGRPTIERIKPYIENVRDTLFFACGPALTKWQKKHAEQQGIEAKPRFMEWVQDTIEELNVEKTRFKREIYG